MDLLIAFAKFTPWLAATMGEDYLRSYVASSPELCSKVLGKILTENVTASNGVVIPRAYGLVIISNLIGSGFALLMLGGRVGRARKDLDVPLPFLYAESSHKHAVKFNSIQRGHAQALETYPIYLASSLVAGLFYPVFTSTMGILWIVARFAWADGYATGVPEKRYTYSAFGKHVWTPLITLSVVSLKVAVTALFA